MSNHVTSMLYDLSYQYSTGVHTMGACLTDGCKESSRGGIYCKQCATTHLAESTSPEFAARAAALFEVRQFAQFAIDEIYEEVADKILD